MYKRGSIFRRFYSGFVEVSRRQVSRVLYHTYGSRTIDIQGFAKCNNRPRSIQRRLRLAIASETSVYEFDNCGDIYRRYVRAFLQSFFAFVRLITRENARREFKKNEKQKEKKKRLFSKLSVSKVAQNSDRAKKKKHTSSRRSVATFLVFWQIFFCLRKTHTAGVSFNRCATIANI